MFRIAIEGEAAALAVRDHDAERLRRVRNVLGERDRIIEQGTRSESRLIGIFR